MLAESLKLRCRSTASTRSASARSYSTQATSVTPRLYRAAAVPAVLQPTEESHSPQEAVLPLRVCLETRPSSQCCLMPAPLHASPHPDSRKSLSQPSALLPSIRACTKTCTAPPPAANPTLVFSADTKRAPNRRLSVLMFEPLNPPALSPSARSGSASSAMAIRYRVPAFIFSACPLSSNLSRAYFLKGSSILCRTPALRPFGDDPGFIHEKGYDCRMSPFRSLRQPTPLSRPQRPSPSEDPKPPEELLLVLGEQLKAPVEGAP